MSKETIVWTRPSGTKLETNTAEATIKHCEKLGFKRASEEKNQGGGAYRAADSGTSGAAGNKK